MSGKPTVKPVDRLDEVRNLKPLGMIESVLDSRVECRTLNP